MSIPSIAQVRPGASVSIVLKADQRTGREVAGQVKDVLTKSNHPHGIKVRLQDGRIGRVQRMLANTDLYNAGLPGDGLSSPAQLASEEDGSIVNPSNRTRSRNAAIPRRPYQRDVRIDDNLDRPSEQIDLMAYIKPTKQSRGRGQPNKPLEAADTDVISCPVCGTFKGDAAAVAHHVETHF